MPIRQSLQKTICADDFNNKSFWFTVKPMVSQNSSDDLAVNTPVVQPALMVSHSELTFADTPPGKPSFLILTIAHQYADTPVTLSTDATDYFQFASDSHPRFAPVLTLIPAPGGSYVHVRYAASRAGLHQGQLLIETPYDSQTVALRGRSRGFLPTLRNTQLAVRPAKSHYTGRVLFGGWPAVLLAVAIAGGLALGGYNYRCQLFPSLCMNELVDRTPKKGNISHPNQLSSNETSIVTKLRTKSGQTEKTLKIIQSRKSTGTTVTTSAKRPMSDLPNNQSPVASSAGIVRNSADRKVLTKQDDDKQTDGRPRPPSLVNPVAEESELERELNRNVKDNNETNN